MFAYSLVTKTIIIHMQVEIVQDFVSTLHDALTTEQFEDQDDVKRMYEKIIRTLNRKYRMSIKKSEINRVYNHLVKKVCILSLVFDSFPLLKKQKERESE